MPKKGFTLIELLVVISILSILSLIGFAAYRNVQGTARDARRKSDIDEIAKAYEQQYPKNGVYSSLIGSEFASGAVPTPPEGGSYSILTATDGSGFRVCAALEGGSNPCSNIDSSTCFCSSSRQSAFNASGGFSGPGSYIGPGGSNLTHSSSCDTTKSLSSGLVGYWRMDESSWNGTTNEVKDNAGTNHGSAQNGANIITGQFNNAGNFNGTNQSVLLSNQINFSNPPFSTTSGSGFTISAWIKPNDTSTRQSFFNNGHGISFEITNNKLSVNIRALVLSVPQWTSANGGSITTSPQNVIVTYTNSNNYKLYINGANVAKNIQGALYSHSSDAVTYIGNSNPGYGSFPYNGWVDDLRIYNRVLTGPGKNTEITNLYNNGNGCIP